jgi:hypothetical protein
MKVSIVAVMLLAAVAVFAQDKSNDDLALALRGAAALKQQLRDPDSLQISQVLVIKRSVHGTDNIDVCYEYNAKNGFGGYAGGDLAAYTRWNGKEKLRIGDEFMGAVGLCRQDQRFVKKGKASAADITTEFSAAFRK